jgi:5-methyltetrahydropteroyltriglutamate--homocysteine methyltransferase
MTQVKTYVPGLYAHSEAQDRETGLQDFLSAQREAGTDYFSDGLLHWPDLFTPLAQRVEESRSGADSGAETVATEKAYAPLGEPHFWPSEMPRGRWISTLPSPLALSHATSLSAQRIAESVLSPQLDWLVANGCAFIVLQETEMLGELELRGLGEALAALESPLPLVLRLPPGDAADAIPHLVELPVEAVGADMLSTAPTALPESFPKTLLAGVVNAANPEPEEPSRVAMRYESLLERLAGEADLHLAPTGDLRALTPESAARQVRSLGDAARILRGG